MSGGVLALFGVCLGVAILELALPGEEGREGPKRFLRFFAALVVLLLILRPIFPFSSTEGGCLAGALDGSGGAAAYEQILQEAVSRRSAEQLRRGLATAFKTEFDLEETEYTLSVELKDDGELRGITVRLKGSGLLRDPREILIWLEERFACEVSVR